MWQDYTVSKSADTEYAADEKSLYERTVFVRRLQTDLSSRN